MSARAPAPPPDLPGFKFVRHLGSGGFADVYLYEQQLLGRRNVAVKVLLRGELMGSALDNFSNEATLMATLSNHPSIVSVFQADIASDGRPFIVMEYCSKPTLHARYRAARFSEAETLRIGVQIAGAVETAHRAGILHRDIKPANILVTDYGRPALTDFGIAGTTSSTAAAGLSVPWAPPEAVESGRLGDVRSDVYSLSATLYTLLAGRTPFEIPGASNTTLDLMGRIQTATLPRIGRPDVLASTEQVLATGLSRNPDDRYPSAMALARALQRVQIERGMQPTTVDVMDDAVEDDERIEDDGRTVVRPVVTIDAQSTGPINRPTPELLHDSAVSTLVRQPADGAAQTQLRQPPGVEFDVDPATGSGTSENRTTLPDPHRDTTRRRSLIIAGGVSAAVLAVGVGIAAAVIAPQASPPKASVVSASPVDAAPETSTPKVTGLKGSSIGSGKVRFTWKNPAPKPGDSYRWRVINVGVKNPYESTEQTSATLPADETGRTCIEVQLRRSNGSTASDTAQACTP
jgi:serine/threonine protein kinase